MGPAIATAQDLLASARTKGAAILGSGLTGISAARWLRSCGVSVTLYDERPIGDTARRSLEALDVELVPSFGSAHPRPAAFFMPSPGVNPRGAFARAFSDAGITALSEIDVFEARAGNLAVGVTGSNGKSTVTSLIADMFRRAGRRSALAGNIGAPLFDVLTPGQLEGEDSTARGTAVIAELSSYQLEWAMHCAPRVGVWLNLTENHLERHGTMEAYFAAKSKLFQFQRAGEDVAVLCADDPSFTRMATLCPGKNLPFGERVNGDGCRLSVDGSRAVFRQGSDIEEFDLGSTRLIGRHNRLNLCAAIAAAVASKLPRTAIEASIAEFLPLDHRLERIDVPGSALYINDSKATSVAAAVTALTAVRDCFPSRPVVLLVGGQAKRGSWEPLARALQGSVRAVIGFGADGGMVVSALREAATDPTCEWQTHPTMAGAVHLARLRGDSTEVILLAPGCASFDAYSGFEERGRAFRELVRLPVSALHALAESSSV